MVWTYHILSFSLSVNRCLSCFLFLAITNVAAMNIHIYVFVCTYVFISFRSMLTSGIPMSCNFVLTFWVTTKLLTKTTVPLHNLIKNVWGFHCFYILNNTCLFLFFIIDILVYVKWYLVVYFCLNQDWAFFPLLYHLGENNYWNLWPFLNWIICLFIVEL